MLFWLQRQGVSAIRTSYNHPLVPNILKSVKNLVGNTLYRKRRDLSETKCPASILLDNVDATLMPYSQNNKI
jgi:hypothetical protein